MRGFGPLTSVFVRASRLATWRSPALRRASTTPRPRSRRTGRSGWPGRSWRRPARLDSAHAAPILPSCCVCVGSPRPTGQMSTAVNRGHPWTWTTCAIASRPIDRSTRLPIFCAETGPRCKPRSQRYAPVPRPIMRRVTDRPSVFRHAGAPPGATKASFPGFIKPALATPRTKVTADARFVGSAPDSGTGIEPRPMCSWPSRAGRTAEEPRHHSAGMHRSRGR